jgi:hypothetical protein
MPDGRTGEFLMNQLWADLKDFDWKAIAAVWGALLSTILFIAKLRENQPIFVLEVVRDAESGIYYRLRVRNSSKHPILIKNVRLLLPREKGAVSRIVVAGWQLRDVIAQALTKQLNIYVRPDQEVEVDIGFAGDIIPRLCILVHWQSHRGLPWPALPKLIFRGKAELQALREHPLPVKAEALGG